MTWISESKLVINDKIYNITNPKWINNLMNNLETICPCCKMECKYCEEKESRRKFIHKMVTGENNDNDPPQNQEASRSTQGSIRQDIFSS